MLDVLRKVLLSVGYTNALAIDIYRELITEGYTSYLEYPISVINYPHVSSGEDYLIGTDSYRVFFTSGSLLIEVA